MFDGIFWQVLHFTLSFQGISNFSNGEMDESCGSVYFPTSVNEFNKIMHQLYQHTAKNSPSVTFFPDKTNKRPIPSNSFVLHFLSDA